MRRLPSVLALSVCLAGLAACGGGPVVGTTRVETPFSDVIRSHKALLVTGRSDRSDGTADARAIATRLVPRLEGLGYFAAVFDETARSQTDLELRITVSELVRVTAQERQGRGDGAGQVKVVVTAALIDANNHAELGRAVISAAGYSGPRGGITEDAEDEVARRVANLVAGKRAD